MRDVMADFLNGDSKPGLHSLLQILDERESDYSIRDIRVALRHNLNEATAHSADLTLPELHRLAAGEFWPSEPQLRYLARHLRVAPR